jgi:hypothetical protein
MNFQDKLVRLLRTKKLIFFNIVYCLGYVSWQTKLGVTIYQENYYLVTFCSHVICNV